MQCVAMEKPHWFGSTPQLCLLSAETINHPQKSSKLTVSKTTFMSTEVLILYHEIDFFILISPAVKQHENNP